MNLKSDENNFYLPRICFASPSIKRTTREREWAILEFTLFARCLGDLRASLYCTIGNRSEFSHTRLCRPAATPQRQLNFNNSAPIDIAQWHSSSPDTILLFFNQNYFLFNELRDSPRLTETRRRIIHGRGENEEKAELSASSQMWKLELNNKEIILFNYS